MPTFIHLLEVSINTIFTVHRTFNSYQYVSHTIQWKKVTSIKELGGPTIGWSSGRVDQPVEAVTPDGRLPNAESGKPLADKADADHLRSIFYRMGFDDRSVYSSFLFCYWFRKMRFSLNNSCFLLPSIYSTSEIVALSGAHALGRCHETASGFSGPWTPTPTVSLSKN